MTERANAAPVHPRPTSDAVEVTLESLAGTGARWAVLHGEDALARGHTDSDIDLVVDRNPLSLYAELVPRLMSNGLHPIGVVVYDIGAAALFLLEADLRGRVQLDLIHDPRGHGRLGLRTDPLLESAAEGAKWPRVSSTDSRLYQAAKRVWKRDLESLSRLAAEITPEDMSLYRRRARTVFATPQRTACVIEALEHRRLPRFTQTFEHRLLSLRRYAARLAKPAGHWIHVDDVNDSVVTEIHKALQHALPYVDVGRLGADWRSRLAALVRIECKRRKPALLVSTGRLTWPFRPDVVLSRADASPQAVVRAMEHRTLRLLGLST